MGPPNMPNAWKWRPDEVEALRVRGIHIGVPKEDCRRGNVWLMSNPHTKAEYIVKVLMKDSRELEILTWLLSKPELLGNQLAFAIPKYVPRALDIFAQLAECIEILHQNNVAHMDIDKNNFVFAEADISSGPFTIKKGTVYLIDFGATRRFRSGPDSGVIIRDFRVAGGHYYPPEGADEVNPFIYDVYSLGTTLLQLWTSVQDCQNILDLPWTEVDRFIWDKLMNKDPLQRPRIGDVRQEWRCIVDRCTHILEEYEKIHPQMPQETIPSPLSFSLDRIQLQLGCGLRGRSF
ncbi:kinase-like domain-containing protein [Cristinia sonorae]|uniref:Kinase-like domain-containing protein n=1 Tax=Cristinia sonorae TaxID=1940300 RepID=A0A8K0XPJ8_9AGAR|nr:kinase-like domain-containing protein [Cristinia sonorae]